jgi:hypothetical protein
LIAAVPQGGIFVETIPLKVPINDWLKERVDEATAQKTYDELLAELPAALWIDR